MCQKGFSLSRYVPMLCAVSPRDGALDTRSGPSKCFPEHGGPYSFEFP